MKKPDLGSRSHMNKEWEPRYSGPNRIGVCVCGHKWEDHHLGCVMNLDYFAATSESYAPEECEFYGSNEMGGLDAEGKDHCHNYRDRESTE